MTAFVVFMCWLGLLWLVYQCGQPETDEEIRERLGLVRFKKED